LLPEARARLAAEAHYRFCSTHGCTTVYYPEGGGEAFHLPDVRVRVGQKRPGPPTPVCYCFHHTEEEIAQEIRRTGASTIPAAITAKVQAGACACETENPAGVCCLGNVRAAVRRAEGQGASPPTRSDPGGRASLWSQAGLLAGAVLASACCWLPLVLIGAGASSLGAASFFAAWRPVFAGFTVVMLGLAWWFTYRRPRAAAGAACSLEGGEACCAAEARPDRLPRNRRIHRILLWPVSLFALIFLFFPTAVTSLLGLPSAGNAAPAAESPAKGVSGPISALHPATIAIEGMDCEACAAGLGHALGEIPGVGRASVDWKQGRAVLQVGDDPATLDKALEVVRASGYPAKILAEQP